MINMLARGRALVESNLAMVSQKKNAATALGLILYSQAVLLQKLRRYKDRENDSK